MLDEFSTDYSIRTIPSGLFLRRLLLVRQAVPARFRDSKEDVFRFKTAEDSEFKPNPEQSESQPPSAGAARQIKPTIFTHRRRAPHSSLLPASPKSKRSSLVKGLNTIFSQ